LENLKNNWLALGAQKQLVVLVATIAISVLVYLMATMSSKPTMALLYSGLEGASAGEVVSALEAGGVPFEVRGTSIFVPANQRDLARMSLAGQGLPNNGGAGYELLDKLSGFGTTSQMFDAAYWRAKEGELARTITASPNIRSARVHISTAGNSPFVSNQKATASISISTAGGGISSQHTKALKFLVASAVPSLDPQNVSVIDEKGMLLSSGDQPFAASETGDRADQIKARVERLLEARVGYGNAIVEVSLETITTTESVVERTIDPDSRVAISTDIEEQSNNSEGTPGGQVTVASNLPDGEGANGGNTSSQTAQTRERTNFEVSEITREVLNAPGAIKRMTVAVLINGQTIAQPDGETSQQARTPEELQALEDLVASAVGLDPQRGDQITVKSLAFEPIADLTAGTPSGIMNRLNFDVMSLIQMSVFAVVALLLGFFVLKPILAGKNASATLPLLPSTPPNSDTALAANSDELGKTALTGEIEDGPFELPEMGSLTEFDLDSPDQFDLASPDPVERLKQTIEDRQGETMAILEKWMEEPEVAQ